MDNDKYPKLKSLIFRAGIVSLLVIMGSGINFISNIFITRFYGDQAFADFSFLYSFASMVAIATTLGTNQIVLMKIPVLSEKDSQLLIKSVNTILAASFLFFSTITFLYINSLEYKLTTTLMLLIIACVLCSIYVKQSLFFSKEKIVNFQVVDKILKNVIFLALLIIFYFFENNSINYILGSFLLACIAVMIYSQFNEYTKNFSFIGFSTDLKNLEIGRSISLYFIVLFSAALSNLDVLLLKQLGSTLDLANFSAAQKISTIGNVVLIALTNSLIPYLVKAKNDDSKLRERSKHSAIIGVLFLLAFLIGSLILGKFALGLFGDGYKAAYYALIILIISLLISALFGQTLTLMKVKGAERPLILYLFISLLIKVLLFKYFYDLWGINGVALSCAITITAWNWLSAWHLKKYYNISTIIIGVQKK